MSFFNSRFNVQSVLLIGTCSLTSKKVTHDVPILAEYQQSKQGQALIYNLTRG